MMSSGTSSSMRFESLTKTRYRLHVYLSSRYYLACRVLVQVVHLTSRTMSDNLSNDWMHSLNGTDEELDERNILKAIKEVTKWEAVGIYLNVPSYKLEEIRQSHSGNIMRCKISLITHWLNNDHGASWKKLADALDDEYHVLATRIRKEFVCSAPRNPLGRGSGDGRSRTPSPTATTSLHSWTNMHMLPIRPSPPTQTIVQAQPKSVHHTLPDRAPQQPKDSSVLVDKGRLLLCFFCGSLTSHRKTTDIAKGPKRRCVELLRESPPPDKMLRYLTQGKLDAFYVGEEGRTLLHYAVIYCEVQCLKSIIAYRGPDVNPISSQGTPLDLAGVNMYGDEIKGLLRDVGAKTRSDFLKKQPMIKFPKTEACRMLILNCSGLSAILHIEVLQQLEMYSCRKTFEMFEWIVATGFSALFILLMVYGHQSLSEVRRLYFKLHRELLQHRSASDVLDTVLKEHLGTEMKMSSIQHPKIMMPALCKTATSDVKIQHIFSNCLQDRFADVPVWKVARYMCVSPPYITEVDGYIGTDATRELSSLALERVRNFYSDSGLSAKRIGGIVRLDHGDIDPLKPCTKVQDIEECRQFVFSPVLPCPLYHSMRMDDRDIIDCVIDTMKQVSENIDSLVCFLK